MPLQATSGAASYDAFGGGVAVVPAYIEDVFSTWLYTGTGATQSINNGIDVTGKGALVWLKRRDSTNAHFLFDTARGVGTGSQALSSNTTAAGGAGADIGFSSTGFDLTQTGSNTNGSGATYASWTFRKQPKFFDIQTWTGSGANRTISHSLGSVPACIIVKRTDTTADWAIYHRSLANTQYLVLNSTAAAATGATWWNSTTPTSSVFSLGTDASVNASAGTYIAYIFAHNAGGFGLTGTDNVISCGSYVGTGAVGNAVTLGYEPQWLLVKNVTSAFDWILYDNMRGMPASDVNTGNTKFLRPNTSDAEAGGGTIIPTATGFQANTTYQGSNFSGETYIYIAIRRGPMKVPTTGTSVFSPNTWTGNDTARSITGANFSPDLTLIRDRSAATGYSFVVNDRLRGTSNVLKTFNTDSETAGITQGVTSFNMNGISLGTDSSNYGYNRSSNPEIGEFFARAPSFMDVVCYTGTGSATTVSHNLAAVPEFMIFKQRSGVTSWRCYAAALGNTTAINLNSASASYGDAGLLWNSTTPTTSVFSLNTNTDVNASAATYVAYLFATCAGVSKVGSYTGTGTTLQINCGFTAGARFVLIKRTNSGSSDWYVWDSARGIIAGNDPYLLLNSTAAEVTSTDYIDTYSAGFEISSTAPAAINGSGDSFIFLAIA